MTGVYMTEADINNEFSIYGYEIENNNDNGNEIYVRIIIYYLRISFGNYVFFFC